MLGFKEAIELAKATICTNCICIDCRRCPWTAEKAIQAIQEIVEERNDSIRRPNPM